MVFGSQKYLILNGFWKSFFKHYCLVLHSLRRCFRTGQPRSRVTGLAPSPVRGRGVIKGSSGGDDWILGIPYPSRERPVGIWVVVADNKQILLGQVYTLSTYTKEEHRTSWVSWHRMKIWVQLLAMLVELKGVIWETLWGGVSLIQQGAFFCLLNGFWCFWMFWKEEVTAVL